jgi:hypothetical protein
MRPVAKAAIAQAQERLEDLEISWELPKRVIVHQMTPDNTTFGEASGKSTCHVLITPAERRRQRVDKEYFAGTIFHELLHCIYYENHEVSKGTPMNMAANEGLAYVADYDFITALLRKSGRRGPPNRMMEQFTAAPPNKLKRITSEFFEDCFEDGLNDGTAIDKWFARPVRPYKVTMGEIVGINIVSKLVEEGWDTFDLLQQSPEVVLAAA